MNKSEKEDINDLLSPKLPTKIIKEVKVQANEAGSGKQYSIKLPIAFIEELNIKKGNTFIIEIDPETKEYSIRLKDKK